MKVGDKAPDILGVDQNGRQVKLSDYAGKKVVLYFYPKDNTPGCSAEACSFRDNYESLAGRDYVVIGVSKDSESSHLKFIDKYRLPFTLIADTDHKLCEQMGVWQLKKMAGREYMGIVRTTFIIGPDGIITDVITKVNTKAAASQIP